jgi:hypothetical protein
LSRARVFRVSDISAIARFGLQMLAQTLLPRGNSAASELLVQMIGKRGQSGLDEGVVMAFCWQE